MAEVHTKLTVAQQTLTSTGIEADKTPNGPIPTLFTDTGQGFTNTVTATAAVINTVDDAQGTGSRTEGTTADPNAQTIIYIGGVAMSAITNPQKQLYPPVFDDARVAPPIKGADNQGTFPPGHIPIPTIP